MENAPAPHVFKLSNGDHMTVSCSKDGTIKCTSANGDYDAEQKFSAWFVSMVADVIYQEDGTRVEFEQSVIVDH